MKLFQIEDTVYDKHITVPSYKVNEVPVYEEWDDCNYRTHRIVKRKRIEGTFTMFFNTIDEFNEFFRYLDKYTEPEGWIRCYTYINNLNTVKYSRFYIDVEPANTKPFFGIKEYDGFDVTIKEV